MNDPHVERLFYRVVTEEWMIFEDPPDREWRTPDFVVRLHENKATVEMIRHCADEDEAREIVERGLRVWETSAGLHFGSPFWSFKFEDADLVDRNPPPLVPGVVTGYGRVRVPAPTMSGTATMTYRVTPARYPETPGGFTTSFEVCWMWQRWVEYRAGREPLAAMAYLCLTILERAMEKPGKSGRVLIEQRMGIAEKVLNKLGHLTSEVGDELGARKAHVTDFGSLTPQERLWIEQVVLAMIRRTGEWAFDETQTFRTLGLSDFPPI